MADDTKKGPASAGPEPMERCKDGFRTRLRYGKGLRGRFTIKLHDEAAATRRRARLQELAELLASAGHSAEARIILRKAAAVQSERDFDEAVRVAEELCKESPRAIKRLQARSLTFRELGEQWTDERLHARFPDQIKKKKTHEHDAARLEHHVYPVIGSKTVASVTLDDCEEVMRKLPAELSPLTRRNVGHLVARLLKLAVYPLRIIEASPIPAGFLPNRGAKKALACLYPDEDRRLLACTDVPFCFRLLWGFLTREGMREGEAFALTWADVDVKRGAVRLDQNKTDDPRAWALDTGTAEALRRYKKHFRAEAEPGDLVFQDPQGRPHTKFGAAELLRGHLRAIGLAEERPELFESNAQRKQIRVHDLRGSFVTISLANDKTESWISDRTGHRSSAMINNYKRIARGFQELDAGTLSPLDFALPELRALASTAASDQPPPVEGGPEVGQRSEIQQERRRPQGDSNHTKRFCKKPSGSRSWPPTRGIAPESSFPLVPPRSVSFRRWVHARGNLTAPPAGQLADYVGPRSRSLRAAQAEQPRGPADLVGRTRARLCRTNDPKRILLVALAKFARSERHAHAR